MTNDDRSISFRVPADVHAALVARAKTERRTLNNLLRYLLADATVCACNAGRYVIHDDGCPAGEVMANGHGGPRTRKAEATP